MQLSYIFNIIRKKVKERSPCRCDTTSYKPSIKVNSLNDDAKYSITFFCKKYDRVLEKERVIKVKVEYEVV